MYLLHILTLILIMKLLTDLFDCFSSTEIPQYRLPYDVVSFEVELMKDLGVKVGISLGPITQVVRYSQP